MPPRDLTGFDPAKLASSAGQPANDPWAKRTGPFTRAARFRGALPGLLWGTGAFAVYLGYEALFLKKEGHHGEGHGEGH